MQVAHMIGLGLLVSKVLSCHGDYNHSNPSGPTWFVTIIYSHGQMIIN
jgi:hypothetical protein